MPAPVIIDANQPEAMLGSFPLATQAIDEPFEGNLSTYRKLSHFRQVGQGDPMWSGACRYMIPGVSPSASQYDVHDPLGDEGDGLDYHVRAGVVLNRTLREADEPTMTRDGRVSAQFDSLPAGRFFQGYFNPRWSGLMAGFRPQIQPRPLTQNFNPNQFGSKELHKATQYKPVPPMGSLTGYYGANGKAL
jgi:hypothetical protein